jgi:5'-nucleotidase
MKIGIIGVTSNLSSNVSATISSRIPQLDNVEVINKWAEVLENEEKCDMIILLSHLGYKEDQAVIPQVHHIDLVVGGHSHTKLKNADRVKNLDGKEVIIVQDWKWGLMAGNLKVSL